MKKAILFVLGVSALIACKPKAEDKHNDEGYMTKTATDANGLTYKYVTNDPMGVKIYTLENGLTVYLAENHDEPRVQTLIPIKAGSKFDPKDNTGLAHYLEHMVFKGTDKIGTFNWVEEEKLLNLISDKYEEHKAEQDPAKKKVIYGQIDSISNVAAGFAIANEYDKMVSMLGAKGTNAFTSNEQTVYLNDIPSNELERWIKLERERFGKLVLRLFHTELEAVYEEFNKGQDNDRRKSYFALMEGMFPTHPYGTQTTIGEAEHLKNPSMVKINEYWNTYYRPNNMAICLSGDFNSEKTIQLIKQYWGDLKPNKAIPEYKSIQEKSIDKSVVKEVFGPDRESVMVGYRVAGTGTKEAVLSDVLTSVLSNGQAGLMDVNLNQQQKVLSAYAYINSMNDYGMVILGANPREGQTLEEAKDLLLAELDKVKKGDFEDWVLPAIVNNYKLDKIRENETNSRVYTIMESFTASQDWEKTVAYLDEVEAVTKEELVAFANKHFKNNHVIVYKRNGTDESVVKVEKPEITPVPVNRDKQSEFLSEFSNMPPLKMEPVFVNFDEALKHDKLKNGAEFSYIQNPSNELSQLVYVFDLGKDQDKELALALGYLNYIGTDKYSPAQIQQEFYKLGLSYGVVARGDRSFVYIDGLEKNMKEGITLLEHFISNAKADSNAYVQYAQGILKKRQNAKLNKRLILSGAMMNYAKYGKHNPFTNNISEEELLTIDPNSLVNKIHGLTANDHKVFYFGKMNMTSAKEMVEELHKAPETLSPVDPKSVFVEQKTEKNKVLFVHHEMVQTDIIMLSSDIIFDPSLMGRARLFNEFYGGGLSSIILQEIREAKGLAYTAYATYRQASKAKEQNNVFAFIGTQPDKVKDVLTEMKKLLNEMPEASLQFESSKQAILSKIESDRIIKDNIFWTWYSNQKRGINHDIRKDQYEFAKTATISEVKTFFDEHIKGHKYTFMVLGNKADVDMKVLSEFGEVEELTLEQVFGY